MSECVFESHPKHGGCCCQCKERMRTFLLVDFPSGRQAGWACVVFIHAGEDIIYLSDEHGMCELFTRRMNDTDSPAQGAEGSKGES